MCVIYTYLCMVANTKCPVDIHATTKLDISGFSKLGFYFHHFEKAVHTFLMSIFFLFPVLRPSFNHLFLVKLFWLTSSSGFLWPHCGGPAFLPDLSNSSFVFFSLYYMYIFSQLFFPQTINLFTSCNYVWFTL